MDSYQIMYRISITKYRPPFNNNISQAFKDLIKKCWDEDPDHRPTFEEILNDLKSDTKYILDDVDLNIYHRLIDDLNKY